MTLIEKRFKKRLIDKEMSQKKLLTTSDGQASIFVNC